MLPQLPPTQGLLSPSWPYSLASPLPTNPSPVLFLAPARPLLFLLRMASLWPPGSAHSLASPLCSHCVSTSHLHAHFLLGSSVPLLSALPLSLASLSCVFSIFTSGYFLFFQFLSCSLPSFSPSYSFWLSQSAETNFASTLQMPPGLETKR